MAPSLAVVQRPAATVAAAAAAAVTAAAQDSAAGTEPGSPFASLQQVAPLYSSQAMLLAVSQEGELDGVVAPPSPSAAAQQLLQQAAAGVGAWAGCAAPR
jgi:hypothetical protein